LIFKGGNQIPNCLSPGAKNLLQRILEPNPVKRITMDEIKTHEWFQKDYVPAVPFGNDDEDSQLDVVLPVKEVYAYGHTVSKIINILNIVHCTHLNPTDW
jgi:5'-AMP-activated protein kinase catalytic alpha subunit